MSERWVLGVDFGTTTTAAAVRRQDEDRAELVRFGDLYRIPSAVLLSDEGVLVAGQQADREGELSPERVERFPKRQLGQGKVVLAGRWFDDVELVAAVLGHVYQQAVQLFDGQPPAAVRLTHPSRWEGVRQGALLRAAARAGLAGVELMPEPVAAAEALTRRQGERVADGQHAAVFDFGGGTLDIALLERRGPAFVVVGQPGGDDHLGGEDIDDRLVAFLAAKLSEADRTRLFDVNSADDPQQWRRAAYAFARQVRQAKESLSTCRVQRLSLPSPPLETASIELTEADLTSAIGSTVQRAVERLDATLQHSGMSADDLALVFLVGGSSRLALVQRKLGPRLQVPLVTYGDPKGMVAVGAAELPLPEAQQGTAGDLTKATGARRVPGHQVSGDQVPRTEPRLTAEHGTPGPSEVSAVRAGPAHRGGRVGPAGGGGRVHRFFAGDAFLQVGQPPSARLTRWFVSEGDRVTLGTPLALVTVPGPAKNAERLVVSPYAGRVIARWQALGRTVEAREPLVDLNAVVALVVARDRPGAGETGFVLDVARPPRLPTPDAVLVRVGRTAYTVSLRTRFSFLLPPGVHGVEVICRFGQQWGPVAQMPVTVLPSGQRALRFLPPSTAGQVGRLWQQN